MIRAYNAEIVYSLPFNFVSDEKDVNGFTYCVLYESEWGKRLGLVNSYEDIEEKDILIGYVDGKVQIIKI